MYMRCGKTRLFPLLHTACLSKYFSSNIRPIRGVAAFALYLPMISFPLSGNFPPSVSSSFRLGRHSGALLPLLDSDRTGVLPAAGLPSMHSGYGGDFASSTGYDDDYGGDDGGEEGGVHEDVPNRKSVITFETPEDEDELERDVSDLAML